MVARFSTACERPDPEPGWRDALRFFRISIEFLPSGRNSGEGCVIYQKSSFDGKMVLSSSRPGHLTGIARPTTEVATWNTAPYSVFAAAQYPIVARK